MKVVVFLISLLLFLGSFVLFGYAFQATGYEALVFFGGILLTVIAFAIPFHLLERFD